MMSSKCVLLSSCLEATENARWLQGRDTCRIGLLESGDFVPSLCCARVIAPARNVLVGCGVVGLGCVGNRAPMQWNAETRFFMSERGDGWPIESGGVWCHNKAWRLRAPSCDASISPV